MFLQNYDIFYHLRILVIFFQILLSTHIISFSYQKKDKYILRLLVSSLISLSIIFIVPNFKFKSIIVDNLYNTIFYITLSVITYINIRICYKTTKKESYFLFLSGYTLQHIGYTIFSMIDRIFIDYTNPSTNVFSTNIFIRRLSFTPLFILLSLIVYKLIKETKTIELASKSILYLSTFSLLCNIFLSLFITNDLEILTYEMMKLMNLLCCLLILFVLFYLKRKIKLEKDIMYLNNFQIEQAKLYKMNLDNRNQLNIKAHDLKHQLLNIQSIDKDYAKEVEKVISNYDNEYTYKRESLNIILQEKNIICKKNQIELNVLIDENCLNFIKDSDLYSLLGNVLDNAIESLLKIQNKNERLIILRIKETKGIIFIKETNPFSIDLQKDNRGNILTIKDDKANHGYGLKSIKMITEKYNGTMNIDTSNSNFIITLTFPKE